MPTWTVPSDTHSPGDTGHTSDHNFIADDLTLIADAVPLVKGGLPGATAAMRYVGATASGAPASGTFAVGDVAGDLTGKLWMCTAAGTPGTWAAIGSGGGMVNPMTAAGDMIYGGSGGTPSRLAIGAAGSQLAPGSGGLPAWVPGAFNAKSYGAAGDGSTDDTTALSNWIAALNTADSGHGAAGYLPAGQYMISGPLPTITADSVTITGTGYAYDSASAAHGSSITANSSYTSATPMLVITGTGCKLAGLSVDGGGHASTVLEVNGDHCSLPGMQVRNSTASGTVLEIGSTGSSCHVGPASVINGVTASTQTGILVGSHDCVIEGSKLDNLGCCVQVNGSGGGLQVQGNHLTPGSAGVNSIWVNGSVNDIMITGNRFDNCGGSDIQITCGSSSMQDLKISNNQFQNQAFASATYVHIAVDTTNHAVNGLQVNDNACYAGGTNIPGYFLAALTQAGGTPVNPGKIATAGSQCNGNIAYVGNSSFWGTSASPTQARGNLVTTSGTTYTSVTDI